MMTSGTAPGRTARPRRACSTILTRARTGPAAAQPVFLAPGAASVAFGWWHWSNGQAGAVAGIGAALTAMLASSKVTPLTRPTALGRRLVKVAEELGFLTGLGAAIIFRAALALGRGTAASSRNQRP